MFYEHKNSKLNLFSYISIEANFWVLRDSMPQRDRCFDDYEDQASATSKQIMRELCHHDVKMTAATTPVRLRLHV